VCLTAKDNFKLSYTDLEQMVKDYGKGIFAYCYHLLKNKEDAEDAVQEVFFKAYKNTNRGKIESVSYWLYRIAHNHCLNILRKNKFKKQIIYTENLHTDHIIPEEAICSSILSDHMEQALGSLSSVQKSILIFRAVNCMKYEEIAIITHKKPETVRKYYERAKNKVMKYFSDSEGVSENGEARFI